MILRIFLKMFSGFWLPTTVLALVAIGVMIRLGIWQLDRHDQRQAFNTRVSAQLAQPPIELAGEALATDLPGMEYRSAIVRGEYDHAQEVVIRNQVWGNEFGVHLLTPLVIAGTDQAVLVDRGWIPAEDTAPERWDQYHEPGEVEVAGMIRLASSEPDFGGVPDQLPAPGEELRAWNNVNIPQIDEQVSYPLLPVYIQQAPDPAWTGMPYRDQLEFELTAGPHIGYAIQWFLFATVLGVGYPVYVRHHEIRRSNEANAVDADVQAKESEE
jgi:surfeit locus 1 family protein